MRIIVMKEEKQIYEALVTSPCDKLLFLDICMYCYKTILKFSRIMINVPSTIWANAKLLKPFFLMIKICPK